ncbi:CPBP family intramembrane glutamic endopeptidase [Fictibacillus barbaricus]|uniref:CPBP family intramembrane metalloprotease n=1 Tax=Fictibacillus barbaricus TaxID=182136 RepID=A0ABS2Z7C1_9BACL|nr:type II CAAX endopeptidase family protein [Fictibacillus barbaricus]MBN3543907.1 CPBP family intramembrane metalloprotease [Fictibacillus barbaricus]GGB71632.1 peptidase [Fictibacillus barbaricus]
MKKKYWWIIFIYIAMQFSGYIGIPLLQEIGVPKTQLFGMWGTISFIVALFIILYMLIPEMRERHRDSERVSRGSAVLWSIIGIFMAYAAQIIASLIELNVFGIEPGSENTKNLVEIVKNVKYFMIVTAIVGPILEEIIFRKIIFGSLHKRFNFFISALISSLIFAAVHADFTHLLIYTAMGFTFAYLYVRTKRLIVPIAAHVAMNTLVLIVQIFLADEIKEMEKQLDTAQLIIGGLL